MAIQAAMRANKRRTLFKLLNEPTAQHPHEEHWYLAVLSTDPSTNARPFGRCNASRADPLPGHLGHDYRVLGKGRYRTRAGR